MGKWTERAYDEELVAKIRALFASVKERTAAEAGDDFTFESFVESFDASDRFTRRLFEFLIRDALVRRRRERRLDDGRDGPRPVRNVHEPPEGARDDGEGEGRHDDPPAAAVEFGRRMRALRVQRQRLGVLADRPGRRLTGLVLALGDGDDSADEQPAGAPVAAVAAVAVSPRIAGAD